MNPIHTLLLMAAYIIVLVLVYIRFFYHRHNGFMRFVKNVLLPITVVGGWVVYFIGYHLGSEGDNSFFTVITHGFLAVFSAGRLFVLGNDLVEIPHHIKEDPTFLLWFSLVGTMAVFLSVSILLHVFGKRLITRARIWLKLSKENHVFFGVNEASISLAQDLAQRDRERLVVFIKKLDPHEDASLYHSAEETGALVINNESFLETISLKSEESIFGVNRESSDPVILNKLRLLKKIGKCPSHLYLMTDREAWNMSMARAVLNEISGSGFRHPVTLHIRISGADLADSFYNSLPTSVPDIRIRLLNYPDIAARQVIAEHNPVDWVAKDTTRAMVTQDFNVMIIGFDQTGNAVLRKLIEYGQFVGSRFIATVTDQAMEIKKGRFNNNYPGLRNHYHLDFIETEAGSGDFFRLVREKMKTLDYIVITLGDDTLNIQTAVDIQQLVVKESASRIKILVQVKNNEHYKHLFNGSEGVSVKVFGRTQDIFTEAIVVRGKLEAMAVRIHDYYNSLKPLNKQKKWIELTQLEQATNISAADHIYIKMALAGIRTEEVRALSGVTDFEELLGKERIDNLAKGEHEHWNAVLFANGWNTWNLNDIPADAPRNKDNQRKVHACLVEWDDLPGVCERFAEDYLAYDYENVKNICPLIKEGIYHR